MSDQSDTQLVRDRSTINLGRIGNTILASIGIAVIFGIYRMDLRGRDTVREQQFANEQLVLSRKAVEKLEHRVEAVFNKLEARLAASDSVQREYGERLRVVETRVDDLWQGRAR